MGSAFIGLFVIVDQWMTRQMMMSALYLCNKGIAFGIGLPDVVFVVTWIGVVGFLGWLWWRGTTWTPVDHVAFVMIFAGAAGNLADRIRYGCVVDYIPFLSVSLFNVADVLITCGALIVAWRMFVTSRR